jgi:uncharacterized protein YrrD
MAHDAARAIRNGILEIKPDTVVLTGGGAEIVGHVDQVVIDPSTRRATHLVVRRSSLLLEDKLLPVEMVARLAEDRIVLHEGLHNLQDLPAFAESDFTRVDEHWLAPR